MLNLFCNNWLYSLTTKSLAFSWQKIPYCCCNSRPKFKTQKLWTWVPLRTSCHRSESYIQHIHGGTTSMLVFSKKIILRQPMPKTPKVSKTLTFVKIPYIYISTTKSSGLSSRVPMENHVFYMWIMWTLPFSGNVPFFELTPHEIRAGSRFLV